MHRFRPTSLVLALSAAALAAPLVVPVGALATPVLAGVAPATVTIGAQSAASGTVTPVEAGVKVQLQLQVDGRWLPLGVPTTTNAAGAWRVAFAPRRGGALRAVQLTGTTGTSGESSIGVRPKVLKPRLARGPHMPFAGVSTTWQIAPATWPAGAKVRIELSIDGRSAGFVTARATRRGIVHARIPTAGVGRFRARLVLPQVPGYVKSTGGATSFAVRGVRVGAGSSPSWNRALRAALRFRGFHVPGGRSFDSRMGESVIAFHKAYGRPRTTVFEAGDWKRLTRARVAVRDRSAPLHIEIDKGRQILMQVKGGVPIMIIPISSGSTGNTPAGRHRIQWKGEWVPSLYGSLLYKSMAFQGTFAIHGYPSVPTTPASHGCVRVPMWIASTLYARSPVGTPVLVYEGPGSTAASIGREATTPDVPELAGVDVTPYVHEGTAPAAT